MNHARWWHLMNTWGFHPNEDTYEALVSAYSQKHRHYHNAHHIDACLMHIDSCLTQIEHPQEVELALWFHDAIYEPLSANNELKSAEWAASFLSSNDANPESISRVYQLIMATVHKAPPETGDESLLVDIDLSILGTDAETYDAFERAIRKEYRMVPLFLYKRKRVAVLQGFLEREFIYENESFRSILEPNARNNLIAAIKKLTGVTYDS